MVPPAGLTNAVGFSLNDAVVSPVRPPPAGGGIDFRYESTTFPSRCDMAPDKIFVSLISALSESGWLLTNKIPTAPIANAFCACLITTRKVKKKIVSEAVIVLYLTSGSSVKLLSEMASNRM